MSMLKVFQFKNKLYLFSTYRPDDKEKLAIELGISEEEIDERVLSYESDIELRDKRLRKNRCSII